MTSQQIFDSTLKTNHVSMTQPRQAVFDALQHHKSLSMADLVKACPNIDRSSVYRTCDVFEKLGIVIRIPTGWKYRLELGEAFHEHHHHATCTGCGGSIALPEDDILEKRLLVLAHRRQFHLTSHHIELTGLCLACSQSS